jgi:hypothetical protein
MAKGQKPADQMEAFSKDAMAQAHQAIDTYFDFLKKSVSSFPTGGTELGEKLKDQSVQNVTAVHDLVKRLSQAKDFAQGRRLTNGVEESLISCVILKFNPRRPTQQRCDFRRQFRWEGTAHTAPGARYVLEGFSRFAVDGRATAMPRTRTLHAA